jgi:urea transporter
MERTVAIFRTLIVAGVGIGILGASIDLIVPGNIPDVLNDAYETYIAEDPAVTTALIVGLITLFVLAAGITSTIGLLLLKPWSRRVALWTTLVSLLTYPALGAMIFSGWATMLLEASMALWGAALAMTYFSELKPRFES